MTTDATKDPKEVLPLGEPSEGEPKEPSAQPEMLTKDQAEKLANERHSTLDTKISTLEKAVTKAAKATEAAEKRAAGAEEALSRAAQEREKAELEGIGDNADALSIFHGKRTLREGQETLRRETAELERSKAEHAEALAEVAQVKILQVATEIASRNKVDASTLVELTDGTKDAMEKLAKVLGSVKPKEPPLIPDSGEHDGGERKPDRYKEVKVLHES